MRTLTPLRKLEFREDVSMMRVGCRQSLLLFTHGYDRILALDGAAGPTRPIVFPS